LLYPKFRKNKYAGFFSFFVFSLRPIAGVALFAVSIIGAGVLSMDDMTGIGIADDFLIGPVSAGVSQGILMIFG